MLLWHLHGIGGIFISMGPLAKPASGYLSGEKAAAHGHVRHVRHRPGVFDVLASVCNPPEHRKHRHYEDKATLQSRMPILSNIVTAIACMGVPLHFEVHPDQASNSGEEGRYV